MICISPAKPLITPVTSKAEIREIQRFRYKILSEEFHLDSVDGIDHRRRIIGDSLDEKLSLFAAYAGGRLVGTIRCGPVSSMTQRPSALQKALASGFGAGYRTDQLGVCDRLAIASEHRGIWLNLELSTAACHNLLRKGCKACFCWARPRLCRLYHRLGFHDMGIVTDGNPNGIRRVMRLEVSDLEHLRKVGSPFQEILETVASNHG
ncbi:MAG: GNAT family N-acetyltransferase [Planctomycetota bacterium]|nr:GNAT family N-acetyltransferase [Planctomycetota bacterium]